MFSSQWSNSGKYIEHLLFTEKYVFMMMIKNQKTKTDNTIKNKGAIYII